MPLQIIVYSNTNSRENIFTYRQWMELNNTYYIISDELLGDQLYIE